MAALHLLFVLAAAPFVEISKGAGEVSGDSAPDRIRLALRVSNHLSVAIDDVEVETTLVTSETEEKPIPGWRIVEIFSDVPIGPDSEGEFTIDRPLGELRNPPASIRYRPRIMGYRLITPDIAQAALLLESQSPADQRAALRSFDVAEDGSNREAIRIAIAEELRHPSKDPTASDALRLRLALRAIANLGESRDVATLFALFERVDETAWDHAFADLSERVERGSSRDDPRLLLFPVNGLSRAIRDAIVRTGDVAVPGLVREASLSPGEETRALATTALLALGRPTIGAQLAVDRETRLLVIRAYGDIADAKAVPRLAELATSSDPAIRQAALDSLVKIGAVEPLVDALSNKNREVREAIAATLRSIASTSEGAITKAAARYGIRSDNVDDVIDRLSKLARESARVRFTAELERGLELGALGHYDAAFLALDRVYAEDPELYMQQARAIGDLYAGRARALLESGNYDAALETIRSAVNLGLGADSDDIETKARVALARGYLSLDLLDRAEEVLGDRAPALRGEVLLRGAELAFEKGDYGRARSLLDRAPASERGEQLNRRLMLRENLSPVVFAAIAIPALLTMLAVRVHRRADATRLKRLIERDQPTAD